MPAPARPVPLAAVLVIALASALAAPPASLADGASGTHLDAMPLTFAAGVRMLRQERAAIDSSRAAGDFDDLSRRAGRLTVIVGAVRSLAQDPRGALTPPARVDVSRVSDSLLAVAAELLLAAGRRDAADVERAVARLVPCDALLDAYVVKQYVCPMRCRPGAISDRPGTCPVCGMHLQLVTDDRYVVEVTSSPARIRANQPTTLSFRIKDPFGSDAADLEVVHEKLIHLMVVSNDLSWFQHVHPVLDGPGRFSLRLIFPAGGTYTLFHDFTPRNVGMQVVPVELTVDGPPRVPTRLVVDDARPKRVDGYDITLTHTWLMPGLGSGFAFWLSRNGKPVTDLEPFLGAMGHLVIVSEDRATYIHSHPLSLAASRDPVVEFGMVFPKTGLYKAWGQFQRRGRVITVPFTVEVTTREPGGPPAR